MDMTVTVAARHSRLILAALFFAITSTAASADDRCQQLEALNQQYAGVTLTSTQQALKRKLVAWYYRNCRKPARRAAASG